MVNQAHRSLLPILRIIGFCLYVSLVHYPIQKEWRISSTRSLSIEWSLKRRVGALLFLMIFSSVFTYCLFVLIPYASSTSEVLPHYSAATTEPSSISGVSVWTMSQIRSSLWWGTLFAKGDLWNCCKVVRIGTWAYWLVCSRIYFITLVGWKRRNGWKFSGSVVAFIRCGDKFWKTV